MSGSAAGHGVPGGECDCCCFAVFLAASLSLHHLRRGGNAPLIYLSSVLTLWSRSDDLHLAPPSHRVLLLLMPIAPGLLFGFGPLVICVFASISYLFHSLLFTSSFVFASLYSTLISSHFSPVSKFSLYPNSDVSELFLEVFPWLSLSSLLSALSLSLSVSLSFKHTQTFIHPQVIFSFFPSTDFE